MTTSAAAASGDREGRADGAEGSRRVGAGLGAARARRRRIRHRAKVGVHGAEGRRAALPGGECGRERTGDVQGPPDHGAQSVSVPRGRDDLRAMAIEANAAFIYIRGEYVEAYRSCARRFGIATPREYWERTRSASSAASIFISSRARAPTSAAKRAGCSNRWREKRASRASGRRFRRCAACGAVRPRWTTVRPCRKCPRS